MNDERERMARALEAIETWLGRKSGSPVNPCQPSCAFMMDYRTLEAIRAVVDLSKAAWADANPKPVGDFREIVKESADKLYLELQGLRSLHWSYPIEKAMERVAAETEARVRAEYESKKENA